MEATVKNTIDARKNAFSSAYVLTDKLSREIDDLFKKIYDFGEQCSDVMDFESKFQSSPLNKEYIDLFTKVAKVCKPIEYNSDGEVVTKSKGEKIAEEIESDAKYIYDDITMPARRKAREEFDSKMRNTPLGKVEQATNMFHLFKRFKKTKPEEINEDDN